MRAETGWRWREGRGRAPCWFVSPYETSSKALLPNKSWRELVRFRRRATPAQATRKSWNYKNFKFPNGWQTTRRRFAVAWDSHCRGFSTRKLRRTWNRGKLETAGKKLFRRYPRGAIETLSQFQHHLITRW